jgi:transposase InsO family protein
MTITMDDTQITTLEQVQAVLASPEGLAFNRTGRRELYDWIDSVLKRFEYFELRRKAKGQVKAYVQRLSGLSRAQVTRLVTRDLLKGEIKPEYAKRTRFATVYTNFDKDLLAQTDNAHGRLSGPATRKILQRQYAVYGDKRFERLRCISSAHIYNLRSSRTYRERAQTVAKTQSVGVSIGIRRKPEPQGRPGYIRVDTVHQGDLNGEKGVYHINMVDAVTQWEIVLCVETISEAHLKPILEIALGMFPFVIVNFHSDNGSEFINEVIAKLLNKLLIEQTKSRSNRTNDNALVEGKNGSVIRKHMGHWHIEQRHAPAINRFYQEHFNPYLNFHRPCGFATVTVDEKGRRRRNYKTYQTPYECLRSLVVAARSKASQPQNYLREGVSLKGLDTIAAKQTDNQAAAIMQAARDRIFKRVQSERLAEIGTR